ncbi:proton-coupled folate transporter-like isoform X3 [Anneissia japonica]|uniref:proton-coupled folate transporter-like isoform X3 n=1 Tax=Anneissia japonica TaxID=1529436 RepID=UPI001425A518|nr:proton-coupled folate transporter-like isoform X3 [Anneissia japonica]
MSFSLYLRRAPVDVTVFIIYLAFTLLSIQGVVFTEYVVLLKLNSTSEDVDTDYTQVLVANWTTIFVVCQSLPAIFIILYVLTWSDRGGRKITMILPTLGLLVTSISFTVVYLYGLPIEYLLVGNLSIGLTGNTILHRSGAGSYISDTCTQRNLTVRMSIILGVNLLGIALGQLCFSIWIDATGFLQPFIFMTVLLAFSLFYITYLMEESVDPCQMQKSFSFKNVVVDIISVVMSNRNNRRNLMWWLMAARIFNSLLVNAIFHGLQLYAIGPPLYMSTSGAGYFTSAYFFSNTVGMLFITKALQRYCNISDYALFYLGSLSAMASSLVIAAATSDTVIYLSVPLAVLAILPKAIVEAQLSKLVEKNEKGAIFAQAGVLDNLGFLLGPIWIGVTYSATVETIPGLIFYIMFAGALVNMLLVIYIQYKFGSIEEALAKSFKSDEEYICGSEETHLLQTSSIMKY